MGEGLPGHIANSAALLCGLGLANLKTSTRVTFLLTLSLANALESMVGRLALTPSNPRVMALSLETLSVLILIHSGTSL